MNISSRTCTSKLSRHAKRGFSDFLSGIRRQSLTSGTNCGFVRPSGNVGRTRILPCSRDMQNGFGGDWWITSSMVCFVKDRRLEHRKKPRCSWLVTVVGSSKAECAHACMWLFTITPCAETHTIAGICSFDEPQSPEIPVVILVVSHLNDRPMDAAAVIKVDDRIRGTIFMNPANSRSRGITLCSSFTLHDFLVNATIIF